MSLISRITFHTKWHRRLGLLSLFFVLLLAVTGILLNHTSSLKLDSIKVRSSLLAHLYNLPQGQPVSFPVQNDWLSHNGLNQLYLNETPIETCNPPLKGAISYKELIVALCDDELLVLTAEGEPIERITPMLGLPANSQSIAAADEAAFIRNTELTFKLDLDYLEFTPVQHSPQWVTAQQPPERLTALLSAQGPAMDLEQILLDLHSGRLFGVVGVLVMDAVALVLILLAISGFITWRSKEKMRQNMKNKGSGRK